MGCVCVCTYIYKVERELDLHVSLNPPGLQGPCPAPSCCILDAAAFRARGQCWVLWAAQRRPESSLGPGQCLRGWPSQGSEEGAPGQGEACRLAAIANPGAPPTKWLPDFLGGRKIQEG